MDKNQRSLIRAIVEEIGITFLSQKLIDDFERIMPDYTVKETKSSYRYFLSSGDLLASEFKDQRRLQVVACRERIKGTIAQLINAQLDEINIFK